MSRHTPGPWVAKGNNIWAGDECIGDVWSHDGQWSTRDANARLIAAAPEMLEALKLIARGGDDVQSFSGTNCAEIARAVIAKAEGGAP